MLIYGDQRETAGAGERLECIVRTLGRVRASKPGLERHSQLVAALISAGQLLQGVEDEGWPASELNRFVHRLAGCVVRSWDSRFDAIGELPAAPAAALPGRVEIRVPEGFAFYAVYPEGYIEAARKLRLVGAPRVIGIRSIGTTLGAIVAATLRAPRATTVRPCGDPFARQVVLPDALIDPDAHYVIVDEGPGLSGSSFGAVADWLQARHVPLERIAFLPSHSGEPGAHASDTHLTRWRRAQHVPASFDPPFLVERFGAIEEFVGGGPWQRRKYLGWQEHNRVLLKFAGLGAFGEQKLSMARALHAGGFTPEPFGLVHGFVVEKWCEHALPLEVEKPVEEIGRYLGARALLFPAPPSSGASIEELFSMCRRNIALALGDGAVSAIDEFNAPSLSRSVKRVRTDNKLSKEEWLRSPNGRLIKTDALDHHQAHDLVGCQDLAWDVAGAIVEFDLDRREAVSLIAATRQPVSSELLEFYKLAYASFRLGEEELASAGTPRSERYRSQLHHLLEL